VGLWRRGLLPHILCAERRRQGVRRDAFGPVGNHGRCPYLALNGPRGMQDLWQNDHAEVPVCHGAACRSLPGVTAPKFDAPHFKEFVVDFTRTGLTGRGK